MGVLRVFGRCCRVFEVSLKGVWKNEKEVLNPSDPPLPFTKLFHKKSFFFKLMASLNVVFDVQKKWYKLPKLGEGGRGNLGNARKKTFFYVRASLCLI